MKFHHIARFWITDFRWPDVSFGIHLCLDGRIDFHFLKWMVSIGRIPVYSNPKGDLYAVSNSFHNKTSKSVRGSAGGYTAPI